jgi:hypothetical protein
MCTLTFIPTDDGYLAGMNRDELLTRPTALAPKIEQRNGLQIVCPTETSGGTWIACNDRAILLALLNWNDVDGAATLEKTQTRGVVIPQLISESGLPAVGAPYGRIRLDGMLPFRLIGIFQEERAVAEWRWDGHRKSMFEFPWARKHWFSSSLSDASAESGRGGTCEKAWSSKAAGTKLWLRALHASHEPAPGAFSLCVHRPDAATVSFTEITSRRDTLSMEYWAGNPCSPSGGSQKVEVILRATA